jgi:hypothetical protein
MKFRLSGEFGEMSPVRDMIPHTGIDLAIPQNTLLRSFTEGVVDRVYDGSGAIGKGLSIVTENGDRMIYGHLNNVAVKVGEKIDVGEVIGLSGSTGHSTAPHLHFAIQKDGSWIDPTPLADKVGEYAGMITPLEHKGIFAHLGEWFHGKITTKITEVTVGHVTDWVQDFAMAAPILLVVSASVFIVINMFSKRLAKYGAIGTMIYGCFLIN